jgi:hypothetical protein
MGDVGIDGCGSLGGAEPPLPYSQAFPTTGTYFPQFVV